MTEEEKIFAGKMFDPRKPELKDLKHTRTKPAANSTAWTNMTRPDSSCSRHLSSAP